MSIPTRPLPTTRRHWLTRALPLALTLATAPQWARATTPAGGSPGAPGPVAELAGRTLDGRAFDLRALRGRVVLVVAWSTDCAVCRDKMPELRSNAAGWRDQPFSLVLLSMDRRRQDAADYEAILARTLAPGQRLTSMWIGDMVTATGLSRRDPRPATWLLDRQGRVVQQWTGRIAPEAWDQIADLL